MRRHSRRHQPVRRHLGGQDASRGDCAGRHGATWRRGRSRPPRDGLLRCHRSHDGHHARHRGPGRRGHCLRAVLRELRSRCDSVRRDAALRSAARTGRPWRIGGGRRVDVRRRRAGRRVLESHARDRHQHAEQPDRQGIHARGAGGDRAAVPPLGRHRGDRRDLRAHHLRRAPARAHGVARRHGRADRDDQQRVEDVQCDRLAGRMDGGAGRSHRRDSKGPRLPDRRGRGASASRRGCRAPSAVVLLRDAGADVRRPPQPAARNPEGGRVRLLRAAGRVPTS